MRLLIADIVRRLYEWPTLLTVFIGALLWWTADPAHVWVPFLVSLETALIIGPVATITSLSRPIVYLPLSRREVWLATWFVATVVATAATTVVKLPALIFGLDVRDGGLATIALSSVYDFAFTGVACSLFAITEQSPDSPSTRIDRLRRGLALFALVGIPLAIVALNNQLPTRWSDLGGTSGTALALMVGVALAGAFLAPRRGLGANRPGPRARKATGSRRFLGGLTGVPRLVVHELTWAIGIGLALSATVVTISWMVNGASGRSEGPIEFLRSQRLLILEGESRHLGEADPGFFQMMVWYAFFAASVCGRFPDLMRHLRALPLSTFRIIVLVVAWPSGVWLAVWAVLLVLSATVGEGVRTLHPALWIEMVGLSALSQALSLSVARRYKWILFTAPAWFVLLLQGVSAAPTFLGLVLAIAALAGAVLLTRAALAHSSTYAPLPTPYPQAQLN